MKNLSLVLIALAFFTGASTFAAGNAQAPKKAKMEMTAEQRQKMADVHQKMADCLRSNKPITECHKLMSSMEDECPMMNHGHHGMMKGGKMKMQDED